MIEPHLAHWLQQPTDGDTGNATRQDARARLRDKIGGNIYAGRRPPSSVTRWLTLHRISSTRFNDLPGEDGMAQCIISIDVWCKGDAGTQAAAECPEIAELVRKSLAGYRGTMSDHNGDTRSVSVAVVRDSMQVPSPPADAQTQAGYTYHWSMDVEIVYEQVEV